MISLPPSDRFVAAIDPGVRTGVAWLNGSDFYSQEFDEHEFYRWMDDHCFSITHLQIERFTINAATVKKTVVYDSLYLIGYMRYLSWRCEFPIEFSTPAEVMSAFPDQALKRAGMHYPGHGHANDAARHLARYMVKNKLVSGSVFLPKER